MHPKHIDIKDFSYDLPEERIAKFPLEERDASKLLIYKDHSISEDIFRSLPEYLPENALMVFNNTRVIHARLLFKRESGAKIEIFCLEPAGLKDYQPAFAATGSSEWICMVGNAKRWKDDHLTKHIETPSGKIILRAEKKEQSESAFSVRFSWTPAELPFSEVIHYAGLLPLPPYLNRENTESDEARYQTIYANEQGSVAAPTAGLHFTDRVFEELEKKNISRTFVTLHVGAGTFRPVKSETLEGHPMHEEAVFIAEQSIREIYDACVAGRKIIAVGTTGTRVLESLFWFGAKLLNGSEETSLHVSQWDAYEISINNITPASALKAILNMMSANALSHLTGSTQILIAPGYSFRIADVLITNFHQPENTLMLLVAAFTGNDWRKIYDHALHNDFRFLSFGDSSVLFRS